MPLLLRLSSCHQHIDSATTAFHPHPRNPKNMAADVAWLSWDQLDPVTDPNECRAMPKDKSPTLMSSLKHAYAPRLSTITALDLAVYTIYNWPGSRIPHGQAPVRLATRAFPPCVPLPLHSSKNACSELPFRLLGFLRDPFDLRDQDCHLAEANVLRACEV